MSLILIYDLSPGPLYFKFSFKIPCNDDLTHCVTPRGSNMLKEMKINRLIAIVNRSVTIC